MQNSISFLSPLKITPIVVILHLGLICWVAYSSPSFVSQTKPRVIVHTVPLKQKVKAPLRKVEHEAEVKTVLKVDQNKIETEPLPRLEKQTVQAAEIKKIGSPVKPKKVLAQPKLKSKTQVKAKSNPKVKTAAKLAPTPKNRELLAKAQESIAKIRTDSVKIDPTLKGNKGDLKIPELVLKTVPLQDSATLNAESHYRDEIAERLKLVLKLPELGNVALKVTLNRSGSVTKLIILTAGSEKNRSYVEKQVPTVRFPPFGSQFNNEAEHTFTINLSHDF